MLFFFFLTIGLYFLIPAVIAQISNPISELVIPTRIPHEEKKTEMETHPIIVEAKIRKHSIQFRVLQTFFYFSLINSFRFIYSMN